MKIAYVGKIKELIPIIGADKIESAIVVCGEGGIWQGCVQKETFKVDDICFVFLQDAELPEIPEFEHMRKHKFRVKMCRFLKTPSEVLITKPFKLDINNVGDEISELLHITKYQKPIEVSMQGETKGSFPLFIPKTDEENFQSIPGLLDLILYQKSYVSIKYDGTSSTFYYNNGEFGICSRNLEKKSDSNHLYSYINDKYKITNNLKFFNLNFAVQGEIIGPKIQNNKLNLSSPEIRVFDIYDIDKREYLNYEEFKKYCNLLVLPTADIIYCALWEYDTFDKFRELAEQTYPNGKQAEGVVVRTYINKTRISFKIINLNYKG